MIAMHEKLNRILKRHALPPIDFRISFDYGNLTIMKTRNGLFDLVGPTINTCSKINNLASINSTVIGKDFHDKIKNFHQYVFQNTGKFSIDLKQPYPIFTIYRKNG
jgi:class 3 adenylate cyclase